MYHTKASEQPGEGRLVNALEFRWVGGWDGGGGDEG